MSTKDLPRIFIAFGKGERAILSVHYGRSHGAFVRRHRSGDIVGRASGGGYDVGAAALSAALAKVFGIPESDGAIGMAWVVSQAESEGVRVFRLDEAMNALAELVGGEA